MTRPLLHACAAALLALFLAVPAFAQEPAPASGGAVRIEDVRRLVDTLENDAERQKLVGQLRGLLEAEKAARPAELEDGVLDGISASLQALGDSVLDAAAALQDMPRLADRLGGSLRDPAVRQLWGDTLWKLAALVLAGIAADRLLGWMLRRPERMMVPPESASVLMRLPFGLLRALVRLVPVAGFAGAAYGVLSVLALNGNARIAALMVVTAYASVRALMVAVRLVVAPRTPGLRLIPVGDETAEYLLIWARRLAGVAMFGVFAIEAAGLLGLPRGGSVFLAKGLGLCIATMLAIFILQNRAAVAAWMRGLGQGHRLGGRMRGLWNRLAEIWHILACLYVAAGYVIWAVRIKGGFEFMLRASVLTVVILVAAGLLSGALRRLIERGFALGHDAKRQFPLLEARANRYLPVLHVVLRGAVIVVTVLAVAQAWGLDSLGMLASPFGRQVLASAISIGVVLLGAMLVWELVSGGIERYLLATDADGQARERSARARTLLPLARNALFLVLLVMVTLIVLSELGVNIAPLLAGAGVIGVAIGFGSQKLVQDVITGIFVLFEDSVSVGDVVQLGAHSGFVEAMTIRSIRLRDFNGSVHTIPFSSVDDVINMTKDFSFAVLDVRVGYREDPDYVMSVLKDLGAEMQADAEFGPLILEPLELVGVDRLEPSAVIVKIRLKTLPIKQWMVMREFNRRLKKRFDELGIEIPFPQSAVWFAKAPPARAVAQEEIGTVPQMGN
jgi:Small-conductance mechanosensitive channel